ncbi:hypothetical protein EVAR_67541_1 [Eumeta japonica]|uniref:Uncharacterized protein n=1 Tax=Eumeta variegata TaxID=151549 RepID=A0A4C1ZVF3_EUMVA|nr:hypothetical protein EVAR_67541_1 [Eumeta japonica]
MTIKIMAMKILRKCWATRRIGLRTRRRRVRDATSALRWRMDPLSNLEEVKRSGFIAAGQRTRPTFISNFGDTILATPTTLYAINSKLLRVKLATPRGFTSRGDGKL